MAFDTFDTDSVATAGVTFTNGNLTAQGGSGAALASSMVAQTIEGKKTGKWYVEFTCVAVSGNVDGVGLVSSWGIIANGGSGGFIGGAGTAAVPSTDMGWAYFTNNHIANKNVTQTSVNNTTWGATDVIGIAIDLTNGKAWWRKNTGNWVGTAGTPDPATNTSGFDISHLTSNNCRVYPAANLSGSAAKFTANFGASGFTGTVPSGFNSGWTNTTAGTYFGTFATTGKSSAAVVAPSQNNKAVSKYTATLTGSVSSILTPYSSAGLSDLKGVIYDDTGTGGLPGALLGVSTNTITTGAYGENSFTFSGVSVTSGSSYWFGFVSDAVAGNTQNSMLCPPQTSGVVFNSGTYASPTNPFGASPSTLNFRYPIIVNITQNQTVSLSGASAAGAVGTFGTATDADIALTGVSAAGAAAAFSFSTSQTISLSGVAAGGAAGTLTPSTTAAVLLSGASAAGAAGLFALTVDSNFTLDGASATALAGSLTPDLSITLYVPLITIMNGLPIPVSADMGDDSVPMLEEMPAQLDLEGVMNKTPIPMAGLMFNNPVPNEGSVP